MSTNMNGTPDAQLADDVRTNGHHDVDEVDKETLWAELQAQKERIAELERREEERPDVYFDESDTDPLQTLEIGNIPLGRIITSKISESDLEDIQETLEEAKAVDERITNEQKMRSRQDTKLRREINTLADEIGVDLTDGEVAGEDKIQRLIVHGPDDVTDRVYPVHERAREVLLHAGEWGREVDDKFGQRITLTSPAVREKLELSRNENLQSKQVRDVFEKIVDLAEDSPRKTVMGKTDDGVTRLRIHLDQEEMD